MRARFTTDEIAAAALRIVDESGLSALSMRSLAAALGTGAMTVYNYVADKEGLEELVVAAVVAEIELPRPSKDWRRDVHAIADAMWRSGRAHPAAIPLVMTRRTVSATGMAAADALVGALARGGLTDLDLLAAFQAVIAYLVGATQTELTGLLARPDDTRDPADVAARLRLLAGGAYPHVEALSHIIAGTSVEEDFDRGLRMLIDGIATRGSRKRR